MLNTQSKDKFNMIKQFFTAILVCILLLTGSVSALAEPQDTISPPQAAAKVQVEPAELQKFTDTVKELLVSYPKFQTAMVQAVEEEGLTKERFTEIYLAQQNPEAQPSTEITEKEQQDFEKAFSKVEQIQLENQSQMKQIVEQKGLEVQRFNQIFAASLEDAQLQQQVRKMIHS